MASSITAVQGDMPLETFDIVQPFSSKSLFWQAAYLVGSDAIDCIPFLFWTVESAAPQVLVSLANDCTKNTEPYFAMCQAVSRLALEARCFNIAPDTPGPAIKRHNADNYDDFSSLLAETHATAANRFGAQSIDLLYIDLASLPDDLAIWHDKLSPHSVLLIHGVSNPDLVTAREACLDQLRIKHIDFTLSHGNGLGIVLGKEVPARLERLSHLQLGLPGYSEVQRVFFRLGKAHTNAYLAKHERSERLKQKNEIPQLRQGIEDAQEIIETLRKRVTKLREAHEVRNQQMATVEARHFDEVSALKDTLSEAESHRDQTAAITALERQLTEGHQTEWENQSQIEDLSNTVARQDGELARLVIHSEETRSAYESKNTWLRNEVTKLKEALQEQLDTHADEMARQQKILKAKAGELEQSDLKLNQASAKIADMVDKKTAHAEMTALQGQLDTHADEMARQQKILKAKAGELEQSDLKLNQASAKIADMVDKKTAHAEMTALQGQLDTRTDELVQLTRLFEAEKTANQISLQDQQIWQAIQVELRDAEIAMLRAAQSRLRRMDAPSRAGLPSVKAQVNKIRDSELFDAPWYLKTYPDVAQSNIDPAQHYVMHGALDGRNPGPQFNTMAYYIANRDVSRLGLNALVHYIMFGEAEKRPLHRDSLK